MPYKDKETKADYQKAYHKIWYQQNKTKAKEKIKEYRESKKKVCPFCENIINGTSISCLSCHNKNQLVNEGFTAERNRFNNSQEWSNVRLECFTRDEYTCQHCSKRGGILNAHHIEFYKDAPTKRLDIKNLMTLCRKCHEKLHWGKNETKQH